MTTDVESVAVIALTGEIDLDNQHELEHAVLAHLATGSVVLDCSQLEFLSISALRSLDACQFAAQLAGRQVVLTRTAPHVARLLAVAGLEHLQRPTAAC